jgi:hypothetical protein
MGAGDGDGISGASMDVLDGGVVRWTVEGFSGVTVGKPSTNVKLKKLRKLTS